MPGALASSHLVECACPSCKAGDALPERLQGIAGAKQLTFIQPGKALMILDQQLRSICQSRCAEFGEPPCFEFNKFDGFCKECREESGEHVDEPLDPNAVVRPLL